ncbi:hypothetical protein D3C80_837950 [compost metagenome]
MALAVSSERMCEPPPKGESFEPRPVMMAPSPPTMAMADLAVPAPEVLRVPFSEA